MPACVCRAQDYVRRRIRVFARAFATELSTHASLGASAGGSSADGYLGGGSGGGRSGGGGALSIDAVTEHTLGVLASEEERLRGLRLSFGHQCRCASVRAGATEQAGERADANDRRAGRRPCIPFFCKAPVAAALPTPPPLLLLLSLLLRLNNAAAGTVVKRECAAVAGCSVIEAKQTTAATAWAAHANASTRMCRWI
eukprot:362295-Chlamydomonas_euryale.AAC.6